MRNLFFVAVIASALIACDSGSTVKSANMTDKAQKNLQASHAITDAFKTGNVAAVDSFVADDYVDHTDQGDKRGKDSLKAMITFVHNNFTDMKMETLRELADDEYVFEWVRYSGNSNGAAGMPVGPYDWHGMEIIKFRDGKAIEHWAYVDPQEMMKWMGQMQQGNMNGGATATGTTVSGTTTTSTSGSTTSTTTH